jgi:hypothetical protein
MAPLIAPEVAPLMEPEVSPLIAPDALPVPLKTPLAVPDVDPLCAATPLLLPVPVPEALPADPAPVVAAPVPPPFDVVSLLQANPAVVDRSVNAKPNPSPRMFFIFTPASVLRNRKPTAELGIRPGRVGRKLKMQGGPANADPAQISRFGEAPGLPFGVPRPHPRLVGWLSSKCGLLLKLPSARVVDSDGEALAERFLPFPARVSGGFGGSIHASARNHWTDPLGGTRLVRGGHAPSVGDAAEGRNTGAVSPGEATRVNVW